MKYIVTLVLTAAALAGILLVGTGAVSLRSPAGRRPLALPDHPAGYVTGTYCVDVLHLDAPPALDNTIDVTATDSPLCAAYRDDAADPDIAAAARASGIPDVTRARLAVDHDRGLLRLPDGTVLEAVGSTRLAALAGVHPETVVGSWLYTQDPGELGAARAALRSLPAGAGATTAPVPYP